MTGLFRTLTLLSLLTGNRVDASVNMRSAHFQQSWTDNGLLVITYNSRSMFQGLFGFGWCSNLEKRLSTLSPSKIALYECGIKKIFVRQSKGSSVFLSENKLER